MAEIVTVMQRKTNKTLNSNLMKLNYYFGDFNNELEYKLMKSFN